METPETNKLRQAQLTEARKKQKVGIARDAVLPRRAVPRGLW
jgi:hypothetical protein